MNKKLVGYWVTTALFCLVMTADGVLCQNSALLK